MSGSISPTGLAVAAGSAGAMRSPGPLDLYRTIAASAHRAAERHRLGLVTSIVLILAYFVLRTLGADTPVVGLWLVAALAVAIVSPLHGLVILAAIAPFNEGFLISRDVGSKSILAVALIVGVGIRWAIDVEARRQPSAPVILAGALLLGSGLGLIRTQARWGAEFANLALQIWVTGVATMLVVFAVAVWVGRRGELAPLVVTMVATAIAGLVSLGDYWTGAGIRDSPVGWAIVGPFLPGRLTGVIRSPTSTAALVMLPIVLMFTAALLSAMRPHVRIGAAIGAVPLVVAAYLTYNRTVFLAMYVLAVVVGWRIRRWLGVTLLVVGLVLGVILVPSYLSARVQAVGSSSQVVPGQVLIASDLQRLTAWGAASRMFLDEPLVGQGYRAYRQLAVEFGDPVINAPHNEWIRFFAEQGAIVGVIGAGFAVITTMRLARRAGWLETGILASFMSLCLAAAFNNVFLFNQVTIPAMILAGTGVALAGRDDHPTGADG